MLSTTFILYITNCVRTSGTKMRVHLRLENWTCMLLQDIQNIGHSTTITTFIYVIVHINIRIHVNVCVRVSTGILKNNQQPFWQPLPNDDLFHAAPCILWRIYFQLFYNVVASRRAQVVYRQHRTITQQRIHSYYVLPLYIYIYMFLYIYIYVYNTRYILYILKMCPHRLLYT